MAKKRSKWIVLVVLLVIILVGGFLFLGGEKLSRKAPPLKVIKPGTMLGDSSAVNQILLLTEGSTEVDSQINVQFLAGLKEQLDLAIDNSSINISFLSLADLNTLLSKKDLETKGKLLIVPQGDLLTSEKLQEIHARSLATITFMSEPNRTCVGNTQSPYLWNFGITSSMYAESYFSYANQRYGQLAKELTFLIYSNMDHLSQYESKYLANVIEGLGLGVLANVSVDDREKDLYSILRKIISLSPKILFATTSREGIVPFVKQTHKLGLGFEMALFLSENMPEEAISSLGSDLDSFIKPSVYINTFSSDKMNLFKSKLQSAEDYTASTYRGDLTGEIINILLAPTAKKTEAINFSRALLSADGKRIDAPSGAIMIHSKARGLIQPLHLGEFKDGKYLYLQYLGDMSPSEHCL